MTSRNYEGMFILDNNAATADFEATSGLVDAILKKHGANIVVNEKWDDRKLAYEIKGRRRGTYYLTYFQAEPDAITKIDEDVHLTEDILRHMVLVLDLPIEEHIDTRNKERELLAEDSRKNSLGGWGDSPAVVPMTPPDVARFPLETLGDECRDRLGAHSLKLWTDFEQRVVCER